MLQPTFTIETIDENQNYARLALEPLEKGYGQTLGVSLRRVLLSSIEGAAVTKVRIKGVQHEFSTLSGMKQDVVELILNIKQLRFSLEGDEPATISLSANGPATVTGADLELPTGVTLVNKDQLIAELADKNASLDVEMTVDKGLGYKMATEEEATTIGEIPVDAAFSPITKVAYNVEATRVGRRTDFDKLVMDIHTDGTIKPQDALEKAANILVKYFTQVVDPVIVDMPEPPSLEDRIEDEALRLTVEELDLPTRIANALRKGGYSTVKDLTKADKAEVAKVKNLGEKSVEAIAEALEKKDLTFQSEESQD